MLYNTSCSHDLMAANLITSNTGEGIAIKRECSQQFSRYATVHFLLYKYFFKHHGNLLRKTFRSCYEYVHKDTKKVLNVFTSKNTFKITKRV